MWSDEEKLKLTDAENDHPNWYIGVANKAVEIIRARGGTMTADGVHDALDDLGDSPAQRALAQHISALGAENARLVERTAYLEGALGDRTKSYQQALREAEGLSANLTEACRKADEQRERAESLERHVSELEQSLENARKERDEAVADNAALVAERIELDEALAPSVLIGYARNHPPQVRSESNTLRWPWPTLDKVAALFARTMAPRPHPGAALLERVRGLEEREVKWIHVAARLHAAAPAALRAATEAEQADWEDAKDEYYALRCGH